eukprot:gene3555-4569_t
MPLIQRFLYKAGTAKQQIGYPGGDGFPFGNAACSFSLQPHSSMWNRHSCKPEIAMYAPVSRQLDAPSSVILGRACAESDGASASACQSSAAAPAHYQKASYVQSVQPAPSYPVELGVSGKLESAASSLPMILIA